MSRVAFPLVVCQVLASDLQVQLAELEEQSHELEVQKVEKANAVRRALPLSLQGALQLCC